MSGYSDGRRVEYAVRDDLKANGYEVIRAASSKGPADLVAFKPGQVLLVNVKRTRAPGPAERAALIRVAFCIPRFGVPIVALKPKGKPIEYRELIESVHGAWIPWTPDEVA